MKKKNITKTTIAGTLICTVFAVLFFGFINVYDINRPPIYLITLGFAGSLSLALFRQKKLRDVIYMNILIYILFAIVSTLLYPITAFILLIYFSALLCALFIYVKYFDRKLSQIKLVRPLVLASTVGLFYIAANFLHGLIFINHFTKAFLLANLPIGFLLGLGIGIGEEISDRI
ncbi:hypothetical protein JW824_07235 [bacterium]|nr:hypothetical protein [bacterium]RQV95289.1 MAG: hypothetical protein EH221_06525 [bacterium]